MTNEKECNDKKCPFHGSIKLRGKTFTGVVLAKDAHRTATIEWSYPIFVPKYERSEQRRTKIHVHNPSCINADIGDVVQVSETRPLSKTKNFVIVKNLGEKKGFIGELEGREEATVEGAQKSEKEPKTEKKEVKLKESKEVEKETEKEKSEETPEVESKKEKQEEVKE